MKKARHIRSLRKAGILKTGYLALFFMLLSGGEICAQNPLAYQVKAAFLFNFTRFVDWPAETFSSTESPFVIGVVGKNPFGSALEQLVEGERVGTHPILIQYLSNITDATNCQMIYISYTDDNRIRQALLAVQGKPTLTVGEETGFNKMDGMVRFYTENNKIRLEINTKAVREGKLNISSKLLSLSKTN